MTALEPAGLGLLGGLLVVLGARRRWERWLSRLRRLVRVEAIL